MRALAVILLVGCEPDGFVVPDGESGTLLGCGRLARPVRPCRQETKATVREVVDGDTIDVLMDDVSTRVRLMGIDAPEHDESDCGLRAKVHLAMLAPPGARLRMVFDTECRDSYGRELVYAFVAGKFINAAMVEDGYAQACPISPNTTHAPRLRCLEGVAAHQQSGLWPTGCHDDGCFHR